jgi:hypothetical protein
MGRIKAAEQLIIFSRYIGQQLVIGGLLNRDEETVGTLIGIKENALLITISGINRWVPLSDDIKLSEIKLLLKPLKRLTSAIIETANSLPVQAFITPYYQSLGFDMPVFIAPGHPYNCKYVYELELADYRTAEEIDEQNGVLLMVNG